jgi:hypothetical protein
MRASTIHETSRREFLLASGFAAAWSLTGGAFALGDIANAAAILHVEPDPKRALIPVLSWDTEGGDRWHTNLLRKAAGVAIWVRTSGQRRNGIDIPVQAVAGERGIRYRVKVSPQATLLWEIEAAQDRLSMNFSVEGTASFVPGEIELAFPFDPMVTATTVLPSQWSKDGSAQAPLIVSAPDFGQMRLNVTPFAEMKARLEGSRVNHTVDLFLGLPQLDSSHSCTLTLAPVYLPPPQGLQDESLWRLARRGWFNAFQPSAAWGDQNRAFSAPAGVLANNVISDPCSLSLMFYADQMRWTPTAAGISLANLVRRSIEFWLQQRTRMTGEVVGYWDYGNFLDGNTGPVIAAWDYVEATGDLGWLEKTIERLEFVADFLAHRDQDGDGLVECTQSGIANSLTDPDRSCIWVDSVNHGHKDAYANAQIYRAWRCLADLESKLHRANQRARYTSLADGLKAAYWKALYNPETGWIADWRSQDGKLHDYASPYSSGIAIAYDLVGAEDGVRIVDKLWAKMRAVGFERFDLGIPFNLIPIGEADYLHLSLAECWHCSQTQDGTDTFQRYMNGGISGAFTLPFLLASYVVGRGVAADNVLRKMLERQQSIGFQNGVQNAWPKGIDCVTWDGKPGGYEGYLADVYNFLTAVTLREPAMRQRFLRPLDGTTAT